MQWYVFALGAAIFSSAACIVQKKTLFKEHAMEFATVLSIFTFVISLIFLPKVNFDIGLISYVVIFIASVLGSIAFLFVAKAIRHLEISVSSPMLNFGPAITAFAAFLFLGEQLTGRQLGGIFILLIGAYALEVDHSFKHLKDPFVKLIKSRHIHYIFVALILYSISSVCDKFVLNNGVDPTSYIVIVHFFLCINFIVMINLMHDGFKGIAHGIKNAGIWILLVAVFTVTYRFLQINAMSLAYVSLVIPIKRLSTLFSSIIGGSMFHEKGLPIKLMGCIIMIWGVIMIVI